MSLISNIAIQTWNTNNKQYFVDLGYEFTEYGDKFEVDISDLKNTSHAKIQLECDFCHEIYDTEYRNYAQLKSDKYCCESCLSHMKKCYDDDGNLYFRDIPYRDKEWLYQEYILKGRTAKDIAKECGINTRTLRDWIERFGLTYKRDSKVPDIQADELYNLYVVQHKTTEEIANLYGTTGNTIARRLRDNDIKIPSRSELLHIYYDEKGGRTKVRNLCRSMDYRIRASCRQHNIDIKDFKGFSTTEEHMIRTSSEYVEWRKKVFERDNYTCQCCGQRGGNLNVHHINNFKDNIEQRTDVNNGITLCEKCHLVNYPNSFHSIYGERNNTLKQLIEYFKSNNAIGLRALLERKEESYA